MNGNIITPSPDVQDRESQNIIPTNQAPRPDGAELSADPLFPAHDSERFRQSWQEIQGSFVDAPNEAVQKADGLVATMIGHLTEGFAAERGKLEANWTKGNDVSTEDLRQAFRHYRSFFNRLLSL